MCVCVFVCSFMSRISHISVGGGGLLPYRTSRVVDHLPCSTPRGLVHCSIITWTVEDEIWDGVGSLRGEHLQSAWAMAFARTNRGLLSWAIECLDTKGRVLYR